MTVLKRILFFAAILSALLLCACGRTEGPETTVPDTTANTPAPETVISYDFRLKELPDIGEYKNKAASCFYDAPLQEFRTSDDYGTLIPYQRADRGMDMGSIGSYGFMTADGKVVTDTVYNSIWQWETDGGTVFFAESKVLDESPAKIDWDADPDGAEAAYADTEDYYYDNIRYLLVTSKGDKALTLTTRPNYYTDSDTGFSLFYCATYESGDDMMPVGCKSFVLYDADLTLLADVSAYVTGYQYAWLCGVEENGFVICAENYASDGRRGEQVLLFFKDGSFDHSLDMSGETVFRSVGGAVISENRICDAYGSTVCDLGESYSDTAYDPDEDCFYVFYARQGKLVKLDREGRVTAMAETQPSTSYLSVSLYRSDGKTYVVIPHSRNYENTDGFIVYDGDLHEICTIGGNGTEKTDFCFEQYGGLGVFLAAADGKSEILDITGKVLTSVPFVYEGYNLNYAGGDKQLIYLYRDNTRCAVYSAADHSVVSIPFHGETISYPDYFSRKLAVYTENVKSNGAYGEYDWRYVIWDITTGKRLLENLSSFNAITVNGTTYFNYLKNDVVYVCDENLNVIAELYDDLFV